MILKNVGFLILSDGQTDLLHSRYVYSLINNLFAECAKFYWNDWVLFFRKSQMIIENSNAWRI